MDAHLELGHCWPAPFAISAHSTLKISLSTWLLSCHSSMHWVTSWRNIWFIIQWRLKIWPLLAYLQVWNFILASHQIGMRYVIFFNFKPKLCLFFFLFFQLCLYIPWIICFIMRAKCSYRCHEFVGFLSTYFIFNFVPCLTISVVFLLYALFATFFLLPPSKKNLERMEKNLVPQYMSSTVYLLSHYYSETPWFGLLLSSYVSIIDGWNTF